MGENYKPLLSVIITAYNREKFLEECIYSIRQQTYKNLEILIIDDYSTDNTHNIVKEIQKDDNRIKYIKHNMNKGAGAAKNTGIEQATGKYITFVDSDDKLANIYAYETAIKSFEFKENVNIYNIGTGKGYSDFEIINNFEKATGIKIPYKVVERRKGDIGEYYADSKKAHDELGFETKYDILDMCQDAWNFEKGK